MARQNTASVGVNPMTCVGSPAWGVVRRLEQAMLEAYQADGWRGANRERFKPTADLDRARRQVCCHSVHTDHGPARDEIHVLLGSLCELGSHRPNDEDLLAVTRSACL